MPMAMMLLPLSSVFCRQCIGAVESMNPPRIRLSTVSSCPMYSSAISRWMVASAKSVIGEGTTCATNSGRASLALSMRSASSAFIAIRASVRTCFPASSAASVTGQCRYGQVPMTIALVSGSATACSQ